MFGHDIIVIGASAGGVDALPRLIKGLPADLPAAVFTVLHTAAQGPGLLPQIIRRTASLRVHHAVDGEKIEHGKVYVAPPDHHLEVEGAHVRLGRGPKENRHRPAIDPLFRSAAESYGARVVGVILTGYLDDGTAGLNAVKTHGGVTVVQDPKEAFAPAMPESALRNVKVDHCVHLDEIGPLLIQLATKQTVSQQTKGGSMIKKRSLRPDQMEKKFGPPTTFVCPECNGPLWEQKVGRSLQYRCHVGHAYSPDSLLDDHGNGLEKALWSAVRMFEERAAFVRRLKKQNYQSQYIGKDMEARAKQFEVQADAIRKLLQTGA